MFNNVFTGHIGTPYWKAREGVAILSAIFIQRTQKPEWLWPQTPYQDGTTQIAFEPVDFIARLAALVPKPRVNLTRYHGVLEPNHRWRGEVTPAKRGKGVNRITNTEVRSPVERHAAMTKAQRLKRVFNIDIEACGRCGGSLEIIACIEDRDIIDRILAHLREREQNVPARPLLVPPTRTHPETLPLFARKRLQFNSTRSARKPLRNSLVWGCLCQVSKVSEKDLPEQQCEC